MKRIFALAAGLSLAGIIVGCAASQGSSHPASQRSAPSVASSATTTPAPVPSPDGTFRGSCDYSLNDNFDLSSNIQGKFLGEVNLENTGNIGTVQTVRVTWPQFGLSPIVRTRTVHVAAGASRTVQFHVPATTDMISSWQSWQERHNFRDGCKYRATIVRTYGSVR